MTLLLTETNNTMSDQSEILPEIRVADLLERAGDIIERHETDPQAVPHMLGWEFADDANAYFRDAYAKLASTGDEDSAAGRGLLLRIDHTYQLAAYHLDQLDRLQAV